jgi:cardiolipin synthase
MRRRRTRVHPLRRFRAMLRPSAGRKLPRALRADRVGAIAGALRAGLADPELPHLLSRIDASPVLGGNRVTLYVHGDEAFAAMLQAVRSAERELLLQSYIFNDDEVGRAFLSHAREALTRGVRVRVLADALGSAATSPRFWEEMADAGIEAHLFRPLGWKFWTAIFRDHRKLLIADGKVAFTGGMNIGEEYGSLASSGRHEAARSFRDTHLRVEGPSAWELAVVFRESWEEAGGATFPIEPLDPAEVSNDGVRALVLDARPGRGHAESAAVLAALVGASRRNVYLTNAYFVPNRTATRQLLDAAARGVDVRLLLPAESDHPFVAHASHGYYAQLLAGGVRIFEYQASILHAKTLVADGQVGEVGSANLDFRSFVFNSECNLVLLDAGVAGELERVFLDDLRRSREVHLDGWRRRPLLERALDAFGRLLAPLL